jgi:nicotinic acid mononucleotide adenylyltransferase
MDPAIRHLIEAIHQANYKCVLALTGGGTSAAAQLLSVPGGSRTVLEVIVPYGSSALVDFLGRQPEHYCSAATSREMARQAYERGCWLAPAETIVGLGCTASLASDRPKRGDHRFHLSWHRADLEGTWSLTLTKGARDREGEEKLLSAVILNMLAQSFHVNERLELPLFPEEKLEVHEPWPTVGPARLLRDSEMVMWRYPDGRWTADYPQKPFALLPGSFNPAHEGHWQLAKTADKILGMPVAFEMSVVNVDKPKMIGDEVRRRLEPMAWRATVVLTRAPLFLDKAGLIQGTVFVIGADTAARIVACRYYDNEDAMCGALRQIRDRGCRFLVAGRVDAAGTFLEVDDLDVPADFRDLFTPIPASEFRMDISSTELRNAEKTRTQTT